MKVKASTVIAGGLRVLVAEGDANMRRLVARELEQAGHDVVTCNDGNELASKLFTDGLTQAGERFDLVVAAVRMPGSTGLDVLEVLRQKDSAPPMILITAFRDDEAIARALELGAVTVLAKPFSLELLVARVSDVADAIRRDTDPAPKLTASD